MTAPLTRHLAIALDLAPLAFITENSMVSSALPKKVPKEKAESYDFECKQLIRPVVRLGVEVTEVPEKKKSAGSGHIIPCNGDVAIPLCARLRSVALFRLSLVGIRRTDGLITGIRLRR